MSRQETTLSPKCTVAIVGPRSQGQNNIWPPKDPTALSLSLSTGLGLSHFFRFLSDWPNDDAINRKKRLESEVVLEDQQLSGINGMMGDLSASLQIEHVDS